MLDILLAVASFGVVLGGCAVFTNAIEWLGKRLELGAGAVGSVLAAVGTAMPETLIAVVAIVLAPAEHGKDIGVGAILGAPLLLSTLGLFICGLSALLYRRRNPQLGAAMNVDHQVIRRDLNWFVVAYCVAAGSAGLARVEAARWVTTVIRSALAAGLVGAYLWYLRLHLREKAEGDLELHRLYLAPRTAEPPTWASVAQTLVGLAFIIGGAYLFVDVVEAIAKAIGAAPLVLSLIVAPIATELPEKLNSVIWTRQGKDTLALGNMTGAMMFQGSIPAALGMVLTEWDLGAHPPAILAVGIALASTIYVLATMRKGRPIRPLALMVCGAFYVVYLALLFKLPHR